MADGSRVTVTLRPEKALILPAEARGSERIGRENWIRGTIDDVVYLGESRKYLVRLPGGEVLIARQQATSIDMPLLRPEQEVVVGWHASDCVVLPGHVEVVGADERARRDEGNDDEGRGMRMRHNGYEINYDVAGSGPPLVLIHGVGSSLRSWDHVVDRCGMPIVSSATIPSATETLRSRTAPTRSMTMSPSCWLYSTRRESRANIVGSSFGGMIAQAFAIAHPERVATVAFLSAVAARTPEQREAVIERADQLAAGGAERTIGAALERWYTPEFRAEHPDLLAEQAARVTANDPKGYAAAYRGLRRTDSTRRSSQIRVPTLIVTGEYDVGSTPEMARLMHDRIAGSRLEILPGLRHGILVEAPDAVANLLRDFLSGNEAARPLPVRSRSS